MKKGKTAVVVGAQWGDEGKGKIVDVLSEKFSVVARYAGGHNAGHTVIINGKRFVLQLVPCGVLREGCRSVIGNGVVLDPVAFLKEVAALRDAGVKVDGNLFVSNRAHVILPYHRMIELASENAPGRVKIGTTSRGIGPSYEDKTGRRGLRVVDLLDLDLLKKHIENACHEKNMIAHALFNSEPLDADKMYAEYAEASRRLAPFVCDTAVLLNRAIADGYSVMFEGAQGTMLDIDHGTYPFVTSSSASAGGACTGTGVAPTRIHGVIGVSKAYITRVGGGPFPTEALDGAGDRIRSRGKEFGSITGRRAVAAGSMFLCSATLPPSTASTAWWSRSWTCSTLSTRSPSASAIARASSRFPACRLQLPKSRISSPCTNACPGGAPAPLAFPPTTRCPPRPRSISPFWSIAPRWKSAASPPAPSAARPSSGRARAWRS